jgi:hypothetical protein
LDAFDDERKYHSKHVEQPRNNKLSYTVATFRHFCKLYHDARNHEYKLYHDARSHEYKLYHDARKHEYKLYHDARNHEYKLVWTVGGMILKGNTEVLRENPVSLPLLPLQISHRMAWDEPGSPLGQSGE